MVLHSPGCGRVGRRRTTIHERPTPHGVGLSSFPERSIVQEVVQDPSMPDRAGPGACQIVQDPVVPDRAGPDRPALRVRAGTPRRRSPARGAALARPETALFARAGRLRRPPRGGRLQLVTALRTQTFAARRRSLHVEVRRTQRFAARRGSPHAEVRRTQRFAARRGSLHAGVRDRARTPAPAAARWTRRRGLSCPSIARRVQRGVAVRRRAGAVGPLDVRSA